MRPNEATMEAPKPTLAAVLEKENLNIAWEAVRANKGAPGPDGRDIASSQAHMRENWENIEAKLRSGEYNPGPVRAVTIPKPNGGERTLGVPNVQDRLIHQAIHAKLSERCEPFFSEHSYGFRPMRSAHDAVRAAQEFIKQGPKPDQRATARPMARLHPRMVELLPTGRKAVGSGRPDGMDPPPQRKWLPAFGGEWHGRLVSAALRLWLRWSTPRGRLNALRRLGVGARACGLAYSGLGAWRIARLWQMNQALSNKRLHQYGFILPWTFAEAAPEKC